MSSPPGVFFTKVLGAASFLVPTLLCTASIIGRSERKDGNSGQGLINKIARDYEGFSWLRCEVLRRSKLRTLWLLNGGHDLGQHHSRGMLRSQLTGGRLQKKSTTQTRTVWNCCGRLIPEHFLASAM